MLFRSLLVALIFVCGAAHAKRFRNAYVSFELPPNWNCKLEGSEWVCENDYSAKTKEAIIILTAKEVGPTDTLPAYLAHLQTPRTLSGRGGMTKSQIIHVKERMIANQMWIDGMHLGSEVGPYFTRYLATIKDRIAILITFSAHKQHYTKYSGDFIKAVESLRVVATKDTLGDRGGMGGGGGMGRETIGAPIGQNIPSLEGEGMPSEGGGGILAKYGDWLLLALIVGVVGVFFFIRSGGGGKGPGGKKPSGGPRPSGPPKPNQPPVPKKK